MAYYRIDPFGEERADLRAGIIASVIVNLFRKKGSEAAKPEDYMPKFGSERRRRKTPQEIYGMIRTWARMQGAKKKS